MNKKAALFLAAAMTIAVPLSAQQNKSKNTKVTASIPVMPFSYSQASMDAFIQDLMSKMTIDEKIGQLNLIAPPGGAITGAVVSADIDNKIKTGQVGGAFGLKGVAPLRALQEVAVKRSRLGIPLIFGMDIIHGHRTIFPIPLGLSCSWDILMIQQSAQVAAVEATADGIAWVYSPMVDISRDPRWGRVSEGAGEDPYLGSQIAAAMVKGYQGANLAADNTVMACVKHFALYGAAEGGRDYNSVDMSRLQMYQNYFPPYKAAVDAGVGSVMSSFNDIDGIPASANKWLMTEVLRNQWGFDGFVVTDYTAINEMIAHGLGDLAEVSAKALAAGTDMDMVGEGFVSTLKSSLLSGAVTEEQINTACRRILEAKYKLGLFENPYLYFDDNREKTQLFTQQTRNIARTYANNSAVLLKNDNNILPLKKSGTIALIGPLADNHINMLGTWSVSGDFQNNVTVRQGIENVAGNNVTVLYAQGANITDDQTLAKNINVFMQEAPISERTAQDMLDEAMRVAKQSDVIVVVVGESANMSGESSSFTNIDLQPSQKRLITALATLNKPMVMVLMNGRPMTIETESKQVNAILDVWFAGTEAGNSVADLLFGEVNPSGKLTMTFPRNVGQIPIYYNMKNTGRPDLNNANGPSKFTSNYLDSPNSPLYPFGYGLSYTQFEYSPVKLSSNSMNANGSITATVTVKNTGKYDGAEVVQFYLNDPVAQISRPVKELKGFQKIMLKKGESRDVTFTITNETLKYYNTDLEYVSDPGVFNIYIGTNSQATNVAQFELK